MKIQQRALPRDIDLLVYVCIAVSFLVCAWLIDHLLGSFTADPDYAYLLNGLDIVIGHAPSHVDHPGTPIQMLIAVIIAITWLVTLPAHGLDTIQDHVLRHPLFYMEAVNAVFGTGILGALLFFCRCIRQGGAPIAAAAVGIAVMFTSYAPRFIFHRIMPEPVLFAGALVLAGLIARCALDPKNFPQTRNYSIMLGVVIGFCLTAKVTSAPLLLAMLFLDNGKARIAALIAAVLSAAFFLLPAMFHFYQMVRGYIHIATHRGEYGGGQSGFVSATDLWNNIQILFGGAGETFLSVTLFLFCLFLFSVLRKPLPGKVYRALLVTVLVIVAEILLVAKQPRPYYLVPVLPFVALGNTLLVSLVSNSIRMSALWLAAAVAMSTWGFEKTRAALLSDVTFNNTNHRLQQEVKQRGCLLVPYYGADDPEFNLFFGNMTAGYRFGSSLARAYPDFVTYHTALRQFMNFDHTLNRTEAEARFSKEKCVELVGVPLGEHEISFHTVKPIEKSSAGTVYELLPGWPDEPYGKEP